MLNKTPGRERELNFIAQLHIYFKTLHIHFTDVCGLNACIMSNTVGNISV